MSKKVSMREAVNRMDQVAKEAVEGKKTVGVASMAIGEVNSLIRLIEVQVSTAKACGKAVDMPTLDFIDLS